ncbi:hypothetical protein [uncultured Sphingomonas sp.]|uniref:hypothetical protein n=1 Tax=uncultured Sphingomonas sp. TaxID=158754 RepID=UPI0035CC6AFC
MPDTDTETSRPDDADRDDAVLKTASLLPEDEEALMVDPGAEAIEPELDMPGPGERAPDGEAGAGGTSGIAQTLIDNANKFARTAGDRAKTYAEDGKARAGSALDELSTLLHDTAGTVDEKLGDQYGRYARSAAEYVSNFSDTLKTKQVDDLVEDARAFAAKSPAIAIGTAAAIGFVLARLIRSGIAPAGDPAGDKVA